MLNRATKLRLRRFVRRGKYRAVDAGEQAEEGLERHFIRRLGRLKGVRRFIFGWISLFLVLIGGLIVQTKGLSNYYLELKPTPGGIYSEGMLGTFTNASPLYATGSVDTAVSSLVFAGLMRYDRQNQLVTDMAETFTVDESEKVYTVKLRPNLAWHDGRPLTAKDVVFTFKAIQNPDAKSPLNGGWQGIKVEQADDLTVVFKLPGTLAAFPHSLTTGILPEHILGQTPAPQLRSNIFNTDNPVGSGPFKWEGIEISQGGTIEERQQTIGLSGNTNYHLGATKLNRFELHTFQNDEQMIAALEAQTITAAVGFESVPEAIAGDGSWVDFHIPITGASYAFFNTARELTKEPGIRRALVLSVNKKVALESLDYPAAVVNQPFLRYHSSYNKALGQEAPNAETAKQLLDSLGWVQDPASGLRSKDGKPLKLSLFAKNNKNYSVISKNLQEQWRGVGIEVEVTLLDDKDIQATVSDRGYDILLSSIGLGPDPDVFAYWHSSQADVRSPNRLNFSNYSSKPADASLEAGRTRSDPALRAVKYKSFSEAWRTDNPALGLYQPSFLYIVRKPLFNFEPLVVNSGADRFYNVHDWMIRESKQPK